MKKTLLALVLVLSLLMSALPASAEMPYYIDVDIANQIVTVYRTSDGSIARQMLCSTGRKNRTPIGTFTIPKNRRSKERKEWYDFPMLGWYAKYSTRIVDSILFHSLPYWDEKDTAIMTAEWAKLGQPASHGCVRLKVEDAKFIAENCFAGTQVNIFKDAEVNEDLRDLLFQASYTGEDGMTYNQFLGMPDDPTALGRFSEGQEVEDLQHRLRALGFFADEITGDYLTSTINAVKEVQKVLRVTQTGHATVEFRELLFSAEAPIAMEVTLQEGMSGPVVRHLQTNLQTLKLYDGDVDGIYDVDVTEAVTRFQRAYGYALDGVALPEIQKAIDHEATQLTERFGNSSYTLTETVENIQMAEVSASTGIRVRAKPTTESNALGRVTDGMRLLLLGSSNGWSQVASNGNTGYVKDKYLEPFTQESLYLTYASTSGASYILGQPDGADASDTTLPCERFAQHLAAEEAAAADAVIVDYATVHTGQDDVMLNLREQPSADAEVLAQLENGSQFRVLLNSGEWTLVRHEGQEGYLLNEYLEFWTGEEGLLGEEPEEDSPATEPTETDDYADQLFAKVVSEGQQIPVYDLDSEDANEIGRLPDGTVLNVLRTDDEWSLIELNGYQGYMQNEFLEFSMYGFE